MALEEDHLCVLVHGLWGNPQHLDYIKSALRERHADENFHILVAGRNAGNYTYDGIDIGGERVAKEIEDAIADFARCGIEIKKFSIVGYSLGGLVSRYAIGLLFARGFFKTLTPVNFTTFVSPHLGIRSFTPGQFGRLWNVIGPRVLGASGRQMFMIDNFKKTGRPLLAVLAQKDAVFYKALAQFKNRCLYANIVNDSVPFYSGMLFKTDPFENFVTKKINYIDGHEQIIVDSSNPVSLRRDGSRAEPPPPKFTFSFPRGPLLIIFLPIGFTLLIVNAGIQSLLSRHRIRLFRKTLSDFEFVATNIPHNTMRRTVDSIIDSVGDVMDLPLGGPIALSATSHDMIETPEEGDEKSKIAPHGPRLEDSAKNIQVESRTLPLSRYQLETIENLDALGFHKHPVHIQKTPFPHAAIILRTNQERFSEGKTVVKHWLDNEFEV